jgi:alkylhydroperoxidase/carboxymuconolactone decarboxylase family protein YurZ
MMLFLAEMDPEFLDIFDRALVHGLLHGETERRVALELKYRELVVACVIAALGGPQDVVNLHFRQALKNGLTEHEAVEALEATFLPAGGLSLISGVKALLALREERAAS